MHVLYRTSNKKMDPFTFSTLKTRKLVENEKETHYKTIKETDMRVKINLKNG